MDKLSVRGRVNVGNDIEALAVVAKDDETHIITTG
jgi:hypothetical protein